MGAIAISLNTVLNRFLKQVELFRLSFRLLIFLYSFQLFWLHEGFHFFYYFWFYEARRILPQDRKVFNNFDLIDRGLKKTDIKITTRN